MEATPGNIEEKYDDDFVSTEYARVRVFFQVRYGDGEAEQVFDFMLVDFLLQHYEPGSTVAKVKYDDHRFFWIPDDYCHLFWRVLPISCIRQRLVIMPDPDTDWGEVPDPRDWLYVSFPEWWIGKSVFR